MSYDEGKRKYTNAKLNILAPFLLFIIIIGALYANYRVAYSNALRHTEEILSSSASEQAHTLEAKLDGEIQTLSAFASSLATQENVNLRNVLARTAAIARSSLFLHVLYCLPDGTCYAETGEKLDLSNREYFKRAMAGFASIEKIDVDGDDHIEKPRIVIAVPITRNGKVVGAVIGSYDEKSLHRLLIPRIYENNGYSQIYDATGRSIVATDSAKFVLKTGNLFDALAQVKMGSGYSIERIKADMNAKSSGICEYEFNGVKRYAFYAHLTAIEETITPWFIFNVVPGAFVDREVAQTTRAGGLLIVLVLVASAIVFAFAIWRERGNARLLEKERERLRVSEEQYRIVAEQSGRRTASYDIQRDVLINDDEYLLSLGLTGEIKDPPNAFIKHGIVAQESVETLRKSYVAIRGGEPVYTCTMRMMVPGGDFRWLSMNSTTIFDDDGVPKTAIMSYVDVTEQREKEIAYERWSQSLRARPPEEYTQYVCNLTRDTEHEEVSGSLLDFEFSPEADTFDAKARDYVERRVLEEDREKYLAAINLDVLLAGYYRGVRSIAVVYREVAGADSVRWLRLSVEMVEYPESRDVVAYLLYEDIDKAKKEELLLRLRSETDPLTGLLNRTAFMAEAGNLIEQTPKGVHHAFMMLDIDSFKLLNDTLGHAAGDEALIDAANHLRQVLRQGDLLGRMGGDEFMICLRDVPYDAVIRKRAEQICSMLHKFYDGGVETSSTIGIAMYPRDGESFEQLYKNSDAALYAAKESEPGGYVFYNPDLADKFIPQADSSGGEKENVTQSTMKRRMLVVDDNRINRELLAGMFKDEFIVDKANDGMTALARMKRYGSSISVVLLDLVMPNMDGFTVMEKMQEIEALKSIPVLVVSAASDAETSLKAIECGASDFVAKPIDPTLIRLRVKAVINKAENEKLRVQNSYLLLQNDEETRYRTVLESTGTVVIEHDWINNVFIYDRSASRYIAGKFDSRPLWRILLSDMVAGAMDVKKMQEMQHELASDRERTKAATNVVLRTPSGEKRWFRFNIFKQNDEFKLTRRMLLTFNDINEEVLAEEKLRYQAERDALTGLYNRGAFIAKAEELIRQRPGNYYVLSTMDIDNFKIVNDMFGHAEGDKLLCRIAEDISEKTKKNGGLGGRLSSDVFATLLPNQRAVLDAIADGKAEMLKNYPLDIELSCTTGRFKVDDPYMAVDAMLDRASLARMTVKDKFGSNVGWYDERLRNRMLGEQEIVGSMESALENGEFHMYLQPKYDLATRRVIGAEALARWIRPEKGMVMPDAFIPVFEKNGFIMQLDAYMWEQVCRQLREWIDKYGKALPLTVSANISRVNINNTNLCRTLVRLAEKYNIPKGMFELEITESAYTDSPKQMSEVTRQLQKAGFTVLMDDFGSGYSSLNMLKSIQVDVLKLDMRFLGEDDEDSYIRSVNILTSIVDMAHKLKLPVIAEGVETEEDAEFLKSINCDMAQGYLFGKPMPTGEFEELLRKTLDGENA